VKSTVKAKVSPRFTRRGRGNDARLGIPRKNRGRCQWRNCAKMRVKRMEDIG
jgi:hypothetical protein